LTSTPPPTHPLLPYTTLFRSRMYHQVDPVQDLDPEEGLGDPLHLQDGPGRGCAHHAAAAGGCERAECRRPSAIRAARRPSARVSSPPGRSLPIPASTRQLPSVAPAIWSSVAPAFLGVAAYFSSTATSLTAIDREGTGTSITCQPKVSAKSNNICLTMSSRGGRGLPVPLPLRSDVPGSGVQGVLDHGACPEQHRHDVVPEQHLRYLRARTCQGAAG